MKSKVIFALIIVIAIVLAIVFWRGGTKPPIETGTKFPYSSIEQKTSGTEVSSALQGVLTFVEKPLLNTPVPLIFTFQSRTPMSNTEAKIELPDGFELVSGAQTWNGNLEANQEQKIEVMIKSTKVGYYQLSGSVISEPGEHFSGLAVIDVEITSDDAIAGSKPENNWHYPAGGQQWGEAPPLEQNNQSIKSELVFSNTPELNKDFTITYRATSLIQLPSERTGLSLLFPPNAFKLIEVQFPQGGETYKRDTQLSWVGKIDINQVIEITATFKVINTGWGSVYGSLSSQFGSRGDTGVVDVKEATLYVDKYGGKLPLELTAT